MAGDPVWLTLILVGGPTTLFSATNLALAVLNKTKRQGERDGADSADLESLTSQIGAIKDDLKVHAHEAASFRLDFETFKAANTVEHKYGREAFAKIERAIGQLQAQMSHVGSGAAGTVMEFGARRDGA